MVSVRFSSATENLWGLLDTLDVVGLGRDDGGEKMGDSGVPTLTKGLPEMPASGKEDRARVGMSSPVVSHMEVRALDWKRDLAACSWSAGISGVSCPITEAVESTRRVDISAMTS